MKYLMAASIAVFAGPAFAQSIDWSGFYVGAHIGAGTVEPSPRIGGEATRMDGLVGGAAAGFLWQHGAFVYGLEADVGLSGIRTSTEFNEVAVSGVFIRDTNWLATVRARAGYAWDNHLVYLTAGLAITELEMAVEASGLRPEDSATYAGLAVGAGYEYALDENWSLKLDYLYADFNGSKHLEDMEQGGGDYVFFDSIGTTLSDLHMLRVGVNYRF